MANFYEKKLGRDAITGRFVTKRELRRRRATTVGETMVFRRRSARGRAWMAKARNGHRRSATKGGGAAKRRGGR